MAELSASKLEAVVSTGLCGAIEDSLQIGDIIEAVEILAPDRETGFPVLGSSAIGSTNGV